MTFFVAARKMSACCFSKMSIGRSRTLCDPHPPTLTPSSFMALQKLERGGGRKDGQWATLNQVGERNVRVSLCGCGEVESDVGSLPVDAKASP